jgi:ABC-2 type transport system permease protein
MTSLAGTGPLVRLILRRDRILLLLWVAVFALLPVAIANTPSDLYPTAAERQSYLDIVTGTPTLLALYGHPFGSSLGALTAWRLGGTVLLVGLASVLTVVRHTRAEEGQGGASSWAQPSWAGRRRSSPPSSWPSVPTWRLEPSPR